MNDLYPSEWRLFLSFFCPSVKLIEKNRVASKTVKRYDKLKAPYQKVLESSEISAEGQAITFDLRSAMEEKLKRIFIH